MKMKKIPITNCMHCPNFLRMNDSEYCTESNQTRKFGDYRIIVREDKFVLDDNNNALECKFPEWCLLEDYNK